MLYNITEGTQVSSVLLDENIFKKNPKADGNIFKRAAKWLQVKRSTESSQYLVTRRPFLASNMYERFSSISGHTMTNYRKEILFINFEGQLFLYLNREL